MENERITETTDSRGNTHTTHIVGEPTSRSGGVGWMIVLLVVVALVLGTIYVSRTNNAEIVKDTAVAEAAGDVGAAAERAGAAVEEAANKVTGE